jgi:hypothetical protein
MSRGNKDDTYLIISPPGRRSFLTSTPPRILNIVQCSLPRCQQLIPRRNPVLSVRGNERVIDCLALGALFHDEIQVGVPALGVVETCVDRVVEELDRGVIAACEGGGFADIDVPVDVLVVVVVVEILLLVG